MRILPTNTALRIVVGPFLAIADGYTPVVSMTVTNCTCELMHEHDEGSAPTRAALTLSASGGANDMVHITNDVGGYFDHWLLRDAGRIGRDLLRTLAAGAGGGRGWTPDDRRRQAQLLDGLRRSVGYWGSKPTAVR